MINHNTQLNLFNLRVRQFKDTQYSTATHKLNNYIYTHNQARKTNFSVEPADINYTHSQEKTYILLSFVPHYKK